MNTILISNRVPDGYIGDVELSMLISPCAGYQTELRLKPAESEVCTVMQDYNYILLSTVFRMDTADNVIESAVCAVIDFDRVVSLHVTLTKWAISRKMDFPYEFVQVAEALCLQMLLYLDRDGEYPAISGFPTLKPNTARRLLSSIGEGACCLCGVDEMLELFGERLPLYDECKKTYASDRMLEEIGIIPASSPVLAFAHSVVLGGFYGSN